MNIALGNRPASTCTACDANMNGTVTINEIIIGVNNALNKCPARLVESSPANGEGGVAVTRDIILRFSGPLDPVYLEPRALRATFGGTSLDLLPHLSADARTVTLFAAGPLPASARVRVTVDGDLLRDAAGFAVDADGDGISGGVALIDFDTLTLTSLPGTAVYGRVFASDLATTARGASVNVPLPGVTITVDGIEDTLLAVTDSMGNFRIDNAPAGRFFVHIDGHTVRTAQVDGKSVQTHFPDGYFYPLLGKEWVSVPGQATPACSSDRPACAGDIYLPLIVPNTLTPVSTVNDTSITFPPSVLAQHPELTGVTVTVPANSLFGVRATPTGMVGIAPVPPDRLPSPLPPGLNFPLVITVQTDGAQNFDAPAPACFPNLPDPTTHETLAPGAKSALWSFSHQTGRWEVIGPMTVSADGKLVCTDPGVGILAPGWHGSQPGTSVDYVINQLLGGKDSADLPEDWPPPDDSQIPCDPETGGYATSGNQRLNATSQEASNNRQAILRAVADSNASIAVVGAAGGAPFGASILSGFNNEKDFDHVAIAYFDPVSGKVKMAEMLVGPEADNILGNPLLGSHNPGPRSLDSFAAEEDRVTAVPIHLSGAEATTFLNLVGQLTSSGSIWSFAATNGHTCASSIAQAIRDSGLDSLFGRADPIFQWNAVTPKNVVDFFRDRNRNDNLHPKCRTSSASSLLPSESTGTSRSSFKATERTDLESPVPTPVVRPFYYRIDLVLSDGSFARLGGVTNSSGRLPLVLPADVRGYILVYDPIAKSLGGSSFLTRTSGERDTLQIEVSVANSEADFDTDRDGLPNIAEAVLGTSPANPDTDSDGVSDFAEILEGTDALGGRPVRTGIVATADTPGTAIDVAAFSDIVAVADSDRGISVFNVFNGMNPTIVAQVDTPGTAQAVALSGNLVAVADGSAGVAIIDITDPPAARIIHQVRLDGSAQGITTAGSVAYVGLDSGTLAVVDLASGDVLDRLTFPGEVQDVAVAGDELFILTGTSLFIHKSIVDGLDRLASIAVPGSVSPLEVGRKLFVGGGLAYIGFFTGFTVVDVSNPSEPAILGSPPSTQAAVHDIVANGSGRVLATTSFAGVQTLAVSVYDGSDPRDVTRFLTSFDTPGDSRALSIYNGLAFVADGTAGLQVINYLPYDALGVPPTIALTASFPLNPAVAEEGKMVRLTANVTDDVQVRNVEFYVDGAKVATDGNFPFEHRFITPRLLNQRTFTLRARATDTGGNSSWTDEIVVALVQDATPPRINSVSPRDGAILGRIGAVAAFFNEPIDPATLTTASFSLREAGADGRFDTADDVTVSGGAIEFRQDVLGAFRTFAGGLPTGRYRAEIAAGVADLAGNRLPATRTWRFSVFDVANDRDHDCVPDALEPLLGLNPDNQDSDRDGVLDGEEDFDGDGLSNCGEVLLETDPTNRDTDGDGTVDGKEDRDRDGLSDADELRLGTNPFVNDSDGDGWSDGAEVLAKTNPLDPNSKGPTLSPGMPVMGMLAGREAEAYYRVAVGAGEHLVVTLQKATAFASHLDIAFGRVPTNTDNDDSDGGFGDRTDQAVEVAATVAGEYFVRVRAECCDEGGDYTITAYTRATVPTLVPGASVTATLPHEGTEQHVPVKNSTIDAPLVVQSAPTATPRVRPKASVTPTATATPTPTP